MSGNYRVPLEPGIEEKNAFETPEPRAHSPVEAPVA
jgi:hypothetical protein